jgi:hypothetical protein
MRQGKLSELIHNSEGSEDLDSCSVEVWFEEIIDRVSPIGVDAMSSELMRNVPIARIRGVRGRPRLSIGRRSNGVQEQFQ